MVLLLSNHAWRIRYGKYLVRDAAWSHSYVIITDSYEDRYTNLKHLINLRAIQVICQRSFLIGFLCMLTCWDPEMVYFLFGFSQFCLLPNHAVCENLCLPALACMYEKLNITDSKTCFYNQKAPGAWLSKKSELLLSKLIIDKGFIEQLLKKNPFFIIFMHSIPISEVGSGDVNSWLPWLFIHL